MASTTKSSNFDKRTGPTNNSAPNARVHTPRPAPPVAEPRPQAFEVAKPKAPPARPAPSVKPPEARMNREPNPRPNPNVAPKPPARPINPAPRVQEVRAEPPRMHNERSGKTTVELFTPDLDAPLDVKINAEWNTQRRAPLDDLAQGLEPDTQPAIPMGGRRVETRSPYASSHNASRSSSRTPREIVVEPVREPESSQTSRHKKGSCQVCGEPLNFFARVCGVKLCKKHYF